MEWVDLGLKRSDEYRGGQAAIAADRFPRSSDPKHVLSRLARPLRLAATILANAIGWRVGSLTKIFQEKLQWLIPNQAGSKKDVQMK